MSKGNYTNKQGKKAVRPKFRVPVSKRGVIPHKSAKDYDRKEEQKIIDIEIELSEQEELEYDQTGRTDS